MNIGEAVRTAVYLQDTNIREVAKKLGMTYQALYYSCAPDSEKGMHTSTAVRILDALDYKLVAIPKEEVVKNDWLEIGLESTGVKKIYRKCHVCGKAIPKGEYSQVTPQGRICQHCINEQFKKSFESEKPIEIVEEE